MTITVYGASDDLIEIEGAISEEFPYPLHSGPGYSGDVLAFSDGTVLRIRLTRDGVWRITPVARGSADLNIEQAVEGDEDSYTDRATLSGDLGLPPLWVVHGQTYAAGR